MNISPKYTHLNLAHSCIKHVKYKDICGALFALTTCVISHV